jgi:hypothetical protein
MNYEDFKNHLNASEPLDEVTKGLLSAFELGYSQGLKEKPYPYGVVFAVEQAIENGDCPMGIEIAFDAYEEERKRK